jgi:hypothetical protein
MDIVGTPFQVIRYGVIAQMAQHSYPCLPEHLPFPQYLSGLLCPVGELLQALPQLLTAGTALDLKVSFLGFPTIVCKSKKGQLLGFLASPIGNLPSKTPELDASGLLLGHFQPESFEPVLKPFLKTLCIILVLKAGDKVSNAEEPPLCVLSEPGVNLSAHRAPIIQPPV